MIMEEETSDYLVHLQPIRDLAKNWDIDIASCLEDYLDELNLDESSAVAADNNNIDSCLQSQTTTIKTNFAQAALLLQNAGSVYSRKVEYLYSLVYQTLETLSENSSSSSDNRRKKKEDDWEEAFDPHVQFLLLDDCLPTGASVDLPPEEEGDQNLSHVFGTPRRLLDTSETPNQSALTLGTNNNLTADQEVAIHTTTKLLVGGLSRDLVGGGLRLASSECDIDNETGAILLPGSKFFTQNPILREGDIDGAAANAPNNESVIPNNNGPSEFEDDYDDHDDDLGGFSGDINENFAGNDDDCNMVLDGEVDRKSPSEEVSAPRTNKEDEKAKKNDPWALLDPHDAGKFKPRPIRVGRTYSLPEGLADTASMVTGSRTRKRAAGRKRSSANNQDEAPVFAVKVAEEYRKKTIDRMNTSIVSSGSHSEGNLSFSSSAIPEELPLTGLAYGNEFAYIARATAKRKAKETRARKKMLLENPNVVPEDIYNNDAYPYGEDDQLSINREEDIEFGGGVDDDGGSFGGDKLSAANVVNNIFDTAFGGPPDNDDDDGYVGEDGQTFEELCRAHIKAFVKGAEKYAAETNLSKRVTTWQSRLAPILEEEEARPEFDIYKYGDNILHSVKETIFSRRSSNKVSNAEKESNVIDFKDVTKDHDAFQVGRLFLASLMLANSGNVILSHEEGAVSSVSDLRIELVKDKLQHPMEKFRAPSVMEVMEDKGFIASQ